MIVGLGNPGPEHETDRHNAGFWLVEALAMAGRAAEARVVLDRARAAFSPLGLLSEDYEVATRRMWGNFPQAYSHVGLIHAAFSASPRWSES